MGPSGLEGPGTTLWPVHGADRKATAAEGSGLLPWSLKVLLVKVRLWG